MIKRILYSCIFLLPWTITIGCIIWGLSNESRGMQDVNIEPNQSYNISPDYCNPSIKALEQELKLAHIINDKYVTLMGKDKQELIDTMQLYELDRKEIIKILSECEEAVKMSISRIFNCSGVLEECNINLKECVLTLKEQCGVVLP